MPTHRNPARGGWLELGYEFNEQICIYQKYKLIGSNFGLRIQNTNS